MASRSISSGVWLKSCSVVSSNYALSLSIDSLPAELVEDPLVLQHAVSPNPVAMQEYNALKLDQNGALRPGGQVALMTRKTIGLIVNYVAIGALWGGLNSLITPFFRDYLQLQLYQVQAATMLLNTSWIFKAIGGFLTDNLNVCGGLRRKPMMICGWIVSFASLSCLGTSPMPQPGETDAMWRYLLFMLLGTVGYFLANVAADAILVEIAQREPMLSRGRTQVSVYAAVLVGAILMNVFVSGTLNGSAYGGTFSWSLNVNQVLLVLATCSIFPLIGSIWFLQDKPTSSSVPMFVLSEVDACSTARRHRMSNLSSFDHEMYFRERLHLLWKLMQSRTMWQLLLFEVVTSFCLTLNSSAVPAIEASWVHVLSWPKAIALVVWSSAFIAGLLVMQRYLLQVSWRYIYCLTNIWFVSIDIVTVTCTVFNVIRNQSFWLYMRVLAAPAVALRLIVLLLPIVELAPRGIEGTTYGLVISFRHVAIPLGIAASNAIGSLFSVSREDIELDSTATRVQVMYTYLIAWTLQLVSMAFIKLLPRQKHDVQQLRCYGGYSALAGWCVVGVLFSLLTFETIASVLSLFKSTYCFQGTGCES